MTNEEKEFITLTFEENGVDEEVEYEVMGVVELDDKNYIVLIPESDPDSLEVFGLEEVPGDEESEEIVIIEDDEEYEKVILELKNMGLQIEIDE